MKAIYRNHNHIEKCKLRVNECGDSEVVITKWFNSFPERITMSFMQGRVTIYLGITKIDGELFGWHSKRKLFRTTYYLSVGNFI